MAGGGGDRTVAVAFSGGAILDVMTSTRPDARGEVVAFPKKWSARVNRIRIDSFGIGFGMADHVRYRGFVTEGVNVARSARHVGAAGAAGQRPAV